MTVEPEVHPTCSRTRRPVLAITADADAATALVVMRRHGVRHLPVVHHRRCVGMLTETRLLRALATEAASAGLRVGHLCWTPAPTVPAGAELTETAAAILAGGLDATLAVEDGIVVGIVTTTDVLGELSLAAPEVTT